MTHVPFIYTYQCEAMARVCELIGLLKAMHHNRIIEFNRKAKLQGNLDSRDVLKILSTQSMPLL